MGIWSSMSYLLLITTLQMSLVSGKLTFIDLTHPFGHKTIYWPSNPPFNMSLAFKIDLGDGIVAVANYFQTAEHSGTHMDAPVHFCEGKQYVHEITLDKLSGPGVKMDLRSKAEADYDYQVSLQDVKDWEMKYGAVPKGAIVLIDFGWDKYWADWEKVFQTDDLSNSSSYHFPGLGIEASRYLAGTRQIHAVGHNTPSTDYGQSSTFEVHINLLCDHSVIILESVANIESLPPTGSYVYIGAIKLANGTGTPVRLFATLDDEMEANEGIVPSCYTFSVFACISLALMLFAQRSL